LGSEFDAEGRGLSQCRFDGAGFVVCCLLDIIVLVCRNSLIRLCEVIDNGRKALSVDDVIGCESPLLRDCAQVGERGEGLGIIAVVGLEEHRLASCRRHRLAQGGEADGVVPAV
jgi:hypothetical protein